MKIARWRPPNYEQICAAFPFVRTRPGIVFTYGDTLYCPEDGAISYHLRVHEQTHMRQQAEMGPEEWWNRYCSDTRFRLDQELEAYQAQYRAMTKADKQKHIRGIAGDLSGLMYGNVISFDVAKRLIRSGQPYWTIFNLPGKVAV